MTLQEHLTTWQNLRLAYQNASRGKRGRAPAAEFEMLLADNLLEIQKELEEKIYQPGSYHSFHIHEPKRRLISAAPFRDRVVHHALCFYPLCLSASPPNTKEKVGIIIQNFLFVFGGEPTITPPENE